MQRGYVQFEQSILQLWQNVFKPVHHHGGEVDAAVDRVLGHEVEEKKSSWQPRNRPTGLVNVQKLQSFIESALSLREATLRLHLWRRIGDSEAANGDRRGHFKGLLQPLKSDWIAMNAKMIQLIAETWTGLSCPSSGHVSNRTSWHPGNPDMPSGMCEWKLKLRTTNTRRLTKFGPLRSAFIPDDVCVIGR